MQLLILFLFTALFLASGALSFWHKTLLFLETADALIKKECDIKLLEGALSYACARYHQDVTLQRAVASSGLTMVRVMRSLSMQSVIEQRYCVMSAREVEVTVLLLVNGQEKGRLRSWQPRL